MYLFRYRDGLRVCGRSAVIREGRGSILIGLIITIVIFSVLGAAMYSMFTSSSIGTVTANDMRKALYMAESGMRYALSELRNSKFSSSVVSTVNGMDKYSLSGGDGFSINIFGMWFESANDYDKDTGGTISLDVAEGGIPVKFAIPDGVSLVSLSLFRDSLVFSPSGTPSIYSYAAAQSYQKVTETSLTLLLLDEFRADQNDTVCIAVQPTTALSNIQEGDSLYVSRTAKDIFPERNGAIYVSATVGGTRQVLNYFYEELIDDQPNNRVELTNISELPTAVGYATGFPFDATTADFVMLSPRNHAIIPTGIAGTGEETVSTTLSQNFFDDLSRPFPGAEAPDLTPEKIVESLAPPVVTTPGAIVVDEATGEIRLGGDENNAFGALWFGGDNNIGGVADFCTEGKCRFNYGARVFFLLDYNGVGDGFTLAFVNAEDNDKDSVGGDSVFGELLAYAGDSRQGSVGPVGVNYLDGTGNGIRYPKMALEFDTLSNTGDDPLCDDLAFQGDQRNDPLVDDRDTLQYVFWGSKEGIPCRSHDDGTISDTYDDNRHDTGGGLQEWAYGTSGDVASSPAVAADGTIYVGSNDNGVYAFNPDGTVKWTFNTGASVRSSPKIGPGGTIYVGSNNGKLYAVSTTGVQQWDFSTSGIVVSSPAVAADGTIYVGSNDGNLYAVSAAGVKHWDFSTGGIAASSPAVAPDGTIYAGSNDGKLYAVNTGGTEKWFFETGGPVRSSPRVGSDGTIYAGSDDNRLYALTAAGTKKWDFATGGDVESSPAVAPDGTIYVGSNDGKLYAVNPDGTEKWSFATGGPVRSSPRVGSDGTIYVGSDDGKLYVLRSNGTLRSAFDTAAAVISSPALALDGTVYVGSNDNKLYAIDPTDNSRNIKDLYYTSDNLPGDVVVDDADDWLNGSSSKGPWAVRMEVLRSTTANVNGRYDYTLKMWVRQCDDINCTVILGTYFEDTRIAYGAKAPHLAQTIELSGDDHNKFERFLFGLTEATGTSTQNATVTNLQLSFIRPGDLTVSDDPSWP